jgi:uncharacterized protein (TIGR02646 family)
MIQLERPAVPEGLSEEHVAPRYGEAERFFARNDRTARREPFAFDESLLDSRDVRSALFHTSNGRCSFCNTPGRAGAEIRPHRLRPAQDAVAADGRTSRRHYWWLAYEWENLFLACAGCRTAQGSKFPTERRRVRVGTHERLAERERPYLIDPTQEDPEPHFAYLDTGEVVWRDERGFITIETFDLNRPQLVSERGELIARTRMEIREVAAMIEQGRYEEFVYSFLNLYSTSPPFAAVRRQLFNQWVQFRPRKVQAILRRATDGEVELDAVAGDLIRVTNRMKSNLSRLLGPTVEAEIEPALLELQTVKGVSSIRASLETPARAVADLPAYSEGREIHTVEIRNFQGVERMELGVASGAGDGSWLMLLGENGTGKTAALKAIALTLMPSEDRERVLPDPTEAVRQGEKEGWVEVQMTGARKARTLHFSARDPRLLSGGTAAPALLAGYGATRLLPSKRMRPADIPSGPHTGSLFDPRFPLSRPADWLPELDREQFDAVARGLHVILQLTEGDQVRRHKRHGLEVETRRGRFRLEQLSEGYRTMAVLALDMMRLFLSRWDHLDAAEGVVLIDEIGAHLHPRWQMKVVSTLRQTFRRVQFIATTHDPLCLRGLEDGEVVVLRRIGERLIVEQEELPSIQGLTVDQLLTSEHFGLYSALDPELEAEFERYYELLAAGRGRAEEEDPELMRLREALAGKKQLGQTRRERLALEAVDEHLAQERWAESARDLRVLPEEARRSVRELLERVKEV